MIQKAYFLALTVDESTFVDNTSWIAVHLYAVRDWIHVPLFISIQKMEANSTTADGLLAVILVIMKIVRSLDEAQIASKLLCFRANGVATFQGTKTGVSKQMFEKFAPFMVVIHCNYVLKFY